MNKFSALATALLITSPFAAGAKTSLNLELSGTANYQERKHFRHSAKCYWKKKSSETHSHGSKSATASLNTVLGWNANQSVSAEKHYKFNYSLSSAVVSTTKIQKGKAYQYSLSLDTTINGTKGRKYEDNKCNHKDMYVSPTSGHVKGEISIEIPFQSKSWLTEISNLKKEGVFKAENMEFFNAAINAKFFVVDEKFYVWAKPGSNLNIKIKLGKTPFGNQKLGGISFQVRAIEETLDSAQNLKENLDRAVSEFSNGKLKSALVKMARVLASINTNNQLIKEIATNDLFAITKDLYKLAHSIEGDAETLLNAKTMAALLSYELTMQLFEDLSPYCNSVDIDSKFTGSTNKVQGLRAAHFWTYRALLALKYFDYSALDALLEQMVSFELNEWTYQYVMQNKDYQEKLDRAYNLLLQQFDFSASPFTRALVDVKQLIKHFPSIGASDSNSKKIFELLEEGASNEDQFMSSLHANFYQYKKQSSEIVSIIPIIEQKKHLDNTRKDIINRMMTQIRFLSIGEEDQQNNFLAKVTEGLLHQVNVFTTESNIEMIENIRASFITNPDQNQTIKTMTQCILGENNEI